MRTARGGSWFLWSRRCVYLTQRWNWSKKTSYGLGFTHFAGCQEAKLRSKSLEPVADDFPATQPIGRQSQTGFVAVPRVRIDRMRPYFWKTAPKSSSSSCSDEVRTIAMFLSRKRALTSGEKGLPRLSPSAASFCESHSMISRWARVGAVVLHSPCRRRQGRSLGRGYIRGTGANQNRGSVNLPTPNN